ncbi:hypothetical protein Zmor_011428 [Zophobas morio]|uniref:Uncharacterized protein n=1 Tax=Zophobas morio TaxID=2755281 RepID=A0AA38IQ62_9CUCU|nr:hypothetical protein Zmor_011428 [Zophobas morio]
MVVSSLLQQFLVLVLLFRVVFNHCRHSYVTICDNIESINFEDEEDVTDLVIGNTSNQRELTSFNLFNLAKFENLKIFIIVGQINRLDSQYSGVPLPKTFDLFSLSNNELRQIHNSHFPTFSARKLSLVNNKIELIEKGTFAKHKVEIFDISDNLLEIIEQGILPSTSSTKTIIIKRNKLSFIDVYSFPSSLRVLNLDSNQLEYIQKNVFEDLNKLEKLTLSHNKLTLAPYVENMSNLRVINLSFNKIVSIERDAFTAPRQLELLDLSYNIITDPNIINHLFIENEQTYLRVNLAFNRLKFLKVRRSIYLVERIFVLYGNPWDCQKLKGNMAKVILCHVTQCDLRLFSSGVTPCCVNYSWGRNESLANYTIDEDIDKFQTIVAKNAHLVGCDLKSNLRRKFRAKLDIPLCDDSEEISFRVSVLQGNLVENILD